MRAGRLREVAFRSMKFLISALAFLTLGPASTPLDLPAAFVGVWRSDEAKTLEDLRKHPEVSNAATRLAEGHFYEGLVYVVERDRLASLFIEDAGEPVQFQPYTVTEIGEDYLKIEQMNPNFGVMEEQQWFFEAGCIYTYSSKWHVREYFCRVQ